MQRIKIKSIKKINKLDRYDLTVSTTNNFFANGILIHNTSAVFSNVLVNKELNLKEKIAKWFGVKIVDKVYDNLYSSRSVIKNQYINKDQNGGYYGEDIWAIVNKELEGKIEQGVTLYGEIVGHLPSGRAIQKGYDYGCNPLVAQNAMDAGTRFEVGDHCKFLVYRITYTKPDGSVIEYSWQQIKEYCKKYSIEHVIEIYHGKAEKWGLGIDPEYALGYLSTTFLEKKCEHCKNDVPSEGIVIRLDGMPTYSAYKLKSKLFLLYESKLLDNKMEDFEVW